VVDVYPDAKRSTPLAGQIMGTGKTALGRNLMTIVKRPREESGELEAEVARRLLTHSTFLRQRPDAEAIVNEARADTSSAETLVTRVLRVFLERGYADASPSKARVWANRAVDRFKRSVVAFVNCSKIVADHTNFGAKVSRLILTSLGMMGVGAPTEVSLIPEYVGVPLFVVFDEVGAIQYTDPSAHSPEHATHAGLAALRACINILLDTKGCSVYCTGRLQWMQMEALTGPVSPLYPRPIYIHPLSAVDVNAILTTPISPEETPLARRLVCEGEQYEDTVRALSAAIAVSAGGNGRAIEQLIRALLLSTRQLDGDEDVEVALETIMSDETNRMQLWPYTLDRDDPVMTGIVRVAANYVLRKVTFSRGFKIPICDRALVLEDALTAVGLSFDLALGEDMNELMVVAGAWQLSLLSEAFPSQRELELLDYAELLARSEGSDRGRPFELMCARALGNMANPSAEVRAAAATPTRQVGQLLRFLNHEAISIRGMEMPYATMVKAPGVHVRRSPLREDEKQKANVSKLRWKMRGTKTVAPCDLAWVLLQWLPDNCIAVPMTMTSHSHDWFAKFPGHIVAWSNKCYKKDRPLTWAVIASEVRLIPQLDAVCYTLVLLAPHMSPDVMSAMEGRPSLVYAAGAAIPQGAGARDDAPIVPENCVVVVVNPAVDGGLADLLGSTVAARVREADEVDRTLFARTFI
jgi:hypothetical protein